MHEMHLARGHCMIGKASGFAGVIYVIIYVCSYYLLGETPVNLLGLGGSSGASDLIYCHCVCNNNNGNMSDAIILC
jgi:hypothetical protein